MRLFPKLAMAATIRKLVSTSKAPGAIGAYSQAVIADKTMYISGQLGMDPKTMELVSDDAASQAKQALTNMGHILEAGGSAFNKVVKTTVLLGNINDFQAVNEVYKTFFTEKQPARAAYQVANLPKGGKVEIEAIAIVGEVKDE
ncbi:2-iminobutanoate/2-iminopropanoate deaminase-like isoform X2 [Actinia tenebrosa]|uniref:2-iminobutanoate/2-iminopropanoate deaminase-like isoform X2 n=1 Tax=Actinia tenebrosa TaxID=6105 RepID=A0A6P8HGF7_ACTTE|nr:2-iminobutanoate/2-iminopropanoate deaminase-like isoform X2 [Actinia tenebrosa]